MFTKITFSATPQPRGREKKSVSAGVKNPLFAQRHLSAFPASVSPGLPRRRLQWHLRGIGRHRRRRHHLVCIHKQLEWCTFIFRCHDPQFQHLASPQLRFSVALPLGIKKKCSRGNLGIQAAQFECRAAPPRATAKVYVAHCRMSAAGVTGGLHLPATRTAWGYISMACGSSRAIRPIELAVFSCDASRNKQREARLRGNLE